MRIPELIDALSTETRALNALVRGLGTEQFRMQANQKWSIKDVLGHIAAYLDAERRALAAGVGRAKEEPIYFDHYQPWNEQQYELRKQRTPNRILAELEEGSARYLALVRSLHEEDLNKDIRFPWDEHGTVHELIVDGLKHRREHREELSALLSQPK